MNFKLLITFEERMRIENNFIKNIKVIILSAIISIFGLNFSCLYAQETSGSLPARDKIESQYKWNVGDIYKTQQDWENDFKWVETNIEELKNFQGKLSSSSTELFNCIKFSENINKKLSRLYLYASLSKDLDLGNAENAGRYDRVSGLGAKVSEKMAFINPEIISMPEATLWKYVDEKPELKIFKQFFNNLLRTKAHTLNKDMEQLLALASPLTQVPYNTFGIFKNAEMPFPTVKDTEGNEITISDGRYYAALYSTDRSYRERVYKGYYKPFMDYKNTFNSLFTGNIKANTFSAKARKYNSNREAALTPNNIPLSVYDNLVKTVDENLQPLHRWAKLKQKILKLKDFHPYDTYVTLFPSTDRKYSYDESKDILLDALKPLGEDYLSHLKSAFNNRWIDVFETKGKRSGAYSSGTTYGVHPYVLLNWNNQLNDVFTFAHEMGHNMHSYYTEHTQPFVYADYSIFVAEVASTANEALLLDYLIEHAKTKEEKLSLIEHNLNSITTTFYRQTRFAAFEQWANSSYEKGEAITPENLSKKYGEMYQAYWGDNMTVDKEETYTWARIPHFYYNFYVFQYATSFAASQAIVAKIKKEGQPAIDKYLQFLKSGSSLYPIDILKKAGVDMNSEDPIKAVVAKMNQLLDEMEKVLNEK